MATISIMGLYRHDDSIFSDMVLPDGLEDHEEDVIDAILMECNELECLYPDPDYMKYAIGRWSTRELDNWQRILDVLTEEYNPIWNKDGIITDESTGRDTSVNMTDHSHSQTGGNTVTSSDRGVQSAEGTAKGSTVSSTEGHASGTDEDTVAGFNATTYQNRNKKSTTNDNSGHDVSGTETETKSANTTANDRTETASNTTTGTESVRGAETDEHTAINVRTEQGNIGVTTTQSMIIEELNLRQRYNIFDIIVNSFKRRFCVLVY